MSKKNGGTPVEILLTKINEHVMMIVVTTYICDMLNQKIIGGPIEVKNETIGCLCCCACSIDSFTS